MDQLYKLPWFFTDEKVVTPGKWSTGNLTPTFVYSAEGPLQGGHAGLLTAHLRFDFCCPGGTQWDVSTPL